VAERSKKAINLNHEGTKDTKIHEGGDAKGGAASTLSMDSAFVHLRVLRAFVVEI
jgi:hypothetical protein